jgi:ATP-dependent Clp protease protease subunit
MFDDYFKKIYNSYIEPTIVEERTFNMTQISVFSRLFMDRILFIGTEITSDVCNIINSQLLFLNSDNPGKKIDIYINSPGGSVYDGLSVYDMFNFIDCPISTTCIGTAASMGAVLLSSGDKGSRNALMNSKVMIHQPLGAVPYTQSENIKIYYSEMEKTKKTLYEILARNTGKDYDTIAADCDRDNWFTSNEAAAYGLIDKVLVKERK